MNRNRWSLLRLLLVGIPFLQQFAAYVLPNHHPTVGLGHHGLKTGNHLGCLFAEQPQSQSASPETETEDTTPARPEPLAYNQGDASSVQEPPQEQQQQDPFQAGFRPRSKRRELTTTLGGGTSLMFQMIRERMLVWGQNPEDRKPRVLPRWHPHPGVSDTNPEFRKSPPAMNNQGFAKSIYRNVRKRNKPGLWRNALRTYDRMAVLEKDPTCRTIQRSNPHHEAAILACAKLGEWQRALEIYHFVEQIEQESKTEFNQGQEQSLRDPSSKAVVRVPSAKSKIRRKVHVTDNMVLSLVRACVRSSNQRSPSMLGEQEQFSSEQEVALRRIPLDTALEILTTLQEAHNIPIVARHVNPLAAAYQSLGYIQETRDVLQTMLSNRTAGEEPEDGFDVLNIHDFRAKDKGSYSLLVQSSVATGDWAAAVEALGEMTEAGLYPNRRHCNIWSEISERQARPRAVGSWKKKRDDNWTDSVR